jgi:hypothetical protein
MKPKVNIVALVDVVGALSDATLHNGNLALMDDGSFDSPGQGTPELCTMVAAGQVIQWTALAVDVQTPVGIEDITFLGTAGPARGCPLWAGLAAGQGGKNLDLRVWAGIVPAGLAPGVTYRYRLELRMHDGPYSALCIDSPALKCA